ncbi:MAG: ABC transporter permease, partial [Thermaerobacterales bacterium]
RMKNTLILASISLTLAVVVAIPLGMYSALNQYSWKDHFLTTAALLGYAVPNFWLGLVFIVVFSVFLGWLPAGGMASSSSRDLPFFAQSWSQARYLVMPAVVLAGPHMAGWMRYMRSQTLEVMREDYVRTARSKGLSERIIRYRHMLKNALIPVITVMGLTIPPFVGGAVIVETVFSYPGMGRLMYDSIIANDYSVAMAVLLLLSFMVLVVNLLTDLSYAMLDPRIRYG